MKRCSETHGAAVGFLYSLRPSVFRRVIGGLGRSFRIIKERCARSHDLLQVFAAFLERGLHPLIEIPAAGVSGWVSIQRKCLRIGVKRGIAAT